MLKTNNVERDTVASEIREEFRVNVADVRKNVQSSKNAKVMTTQAEFLKLERGEEIKKKESAGATESSRKSLSLPTKAPARTTFKSKIVETCRRAPVKEKTARNISKIAETVRFDSKGDSIHEDEDSELSNEDQHEKKPNDDDLEDLIDSRNEASDGRQDSDQESDEDDGIPVITIPLGDILRKYARMMGGGNSKYEYEYEDEDSKGIVIKEIISNEIDEDSRPEEL